MELQRAGTDRSEALDAVIYVCIPITSEPINFLEVIRVVASLIVPFMYRLTDLRKKDELSVVSCTCGGIVARQSFNLFGVVTQDMKEEWAITGLDEPSIKVLFPVRRVLTIDGAVRSYRTGY